MLYKYYSNCMKITLPLQTDLHVVLIRGKLTIPDYWGVNKNLSISLVNGLYIMACCVHKSHNAYFIAEVVETFSI